MRNSRNAALGTREGLLATAERLFASEGIDAVSTRRIAQEAGQRNNSALQYHFGDRRALLAEIMATRMASINQRRQGMLDELTKRSRAARLTDLVTVLVVPFAEQLLAGERGRNYVRIAAQLFAKSQGVAILGPERPWNEAFYATLQRIRTFLPALPRAVQNRRFVFLAGHLVQASAAADIEWGDIDQRARVLRVRTLADDLVDYSTGALQAERSSVAGTLIARPAEKAAAFGEVRPKRRASKTRTRAPDRKAV